MLTPGFSESYLADIGRVIVLWSQAEHHFLLVFLGFYVMEGKSSGSLKDPRIKYMGLPLNKQIQAFKERLVELKTPEPHLRKVTKILDRTLKLRGERDKVAHTLWQAEAVLVDGKHILDQTQVHSISKSWRNSKPHESEMIKQGDLQKISRKIHSLRQDLIQLTLDETWRGSHAPLISGGT